MYNESEGIEDTIDEVRIIARALTDDYEIIISDDASTDGCADMVGGLAKEDPLLKLIRQETNSKFGGALAAGLKAAGKEIIIYTDSDLPISLHDIKMSLPMIENADVVTAVSKVHKGENLKRKIISFGYNSLLKILFGMNLRDINSGYKIFRKSILEGVELMSKSPFVDAEIFVKVLRKGGRVKEYPIIFRARKQGVSKVARISVILATFRDMFIFRLKG